ncbi:unnamed protein product [Rhodiola kirilowii]
MTSLSNKPSNECGNCSFKDRWLLHYVRLRGEHRRLCTSCVLKLHPAAFCSICFELFEGSLPHHERVNCNKCSSVTHPGCVADSDNVSKSYTCASCSDPKFRFFDVKRDGENRMEIDLKSAKVLLCAARISAESMSRAVNVAEADAHRRVKEATVSRKRAREALEEMCAMVAKEKARKAGENGSAAGTAIGVDNNKDRMIVASFPGSSSNVGLQSIPSSRSLVLGSGGNSNIPQSSIMSNGNAGRSATTGTSVPSQPTNADGKHGTSTSSPTHPAEDGK